MARCGLGRGRPEAAGSLCDLLGDGKRASPRACRAKDVAWGGCSARLSMSEAVGGRSEAASSTQWTITASLVRRRCLRRCAARQRLVVQLRLCCFLHLLELRLWHIYAPRVAPQAARQLWQRQRRHHWLVCGCAAAAVCKGETALSARLLTAPPPPPPPPHRRASGSS
jgi:hypothetical protein